MEKYNIYLKAQKPIRFYDICLIHQPSFEGILDYEVVDGSGELKYGIEAFEKLLLPYYITLDNITEELTDEQKEGLTNFDLLCSSQEFMGYLFMSLEFFCKSDMDIDEEGTISFKGFKGKLHKNNFDEFAETILQICGRERQKVEKKVFKNNIQRDIWEKLQAGRAKTASQNELKLEDVLNVCEFGGRYYIPMENIQKWSLWRIINCYKTIMGISSYEDSFSIYLINGEKELIEGKHWSELIKLSYKPKE